MSDLEDLKNTIAGKKPAALVHVDNLNDYKPLVTKAKAQKLSVVYLPTQEGHDLIVGQAGNVEKIKNALLSVRDKKGNLKKRFPDTYHRELGEALGYSKENVDHFITNQKSEKRKFLAQRRKRRKVNE